MTSKQVTHQTRDQTKFQLLSKALSVSTQTVCATRYYFENILRHALLLKLNYSNIMQVPQITKIIILAHSVPLNNVKSVSLALEIISGQKVFSTVFSDTQGLLAYQFVRSDYKARLRSDLKGATKERITSVRSARIRRDLGARNHQKRSETTKQSGNLSVRKVTARQSNSSYPNTALLCCSLRGVNMYNFLEKLISLRLTSLLAYNSYDYKIQGQEVQITFSNREVRLFPEIQNHFEFFESLKAIQIKFVTSARNERETLLLWKGLKQKEI